MSTETRVCRNCNGDGVVTKRRLIFFLRTDLCPACNGAGRTPDRPARSTRAGVRKDEVYVPPLAALDPYYIPSGHSHASHEPDFHGKGGAFGGGGANGSWTDDRPGGSVLDPTVHAPSHRDSSSHHHTSDYGHHSSSDYGGDSGGGGGSDGGSSGGD